MDLDQKILETARRKFLDNGIVKCEMKDIAAELGCSRSTLYRHFANKSEILVVLAESAVKIIFASVIVPPNMRFICGYDELAWQIDSLVNALVAHIDEVTFLRDFDCLYSKEYPDNPETNVFIRQVTGSASQSPMLATINRGIEDGSIKRIDNPELFVSTLTHGCVAMAQRILPREHFFIKEHGYGQEMLRYHAQLVLNSIRAE